MQSAKIDIIFKHGEKENLQRKRDGNKKLILKSSISRLTILTQKNRKDAETEVMPLYKI